MNRQDQQQQQRPSRAERRRRREEERARRRERREQHAMQKEETTATDYFESYKKSLVGIRFAFPTRLPSESFDPHNGIQVVKEKLTETSPWLLEGKFCMLQGAPCRITRAKDTRTEEEKKDKKGLSKAKVYGVCLFTKRKYEEEVQHPWSVAVPMIMAKEEGNSCPSNMKSSPSIQVYWKANTCMDEYKRPLLPPDKDHFVIETVRNTDDGGRETALWTIPMQSDFYQAVLQQSYLVNIQNKHRFYQFVCAVHRMDNDAISQIFREGSHEGVVRRIFDFVYDSKEKRPPVLWERTPVKKAPAIRERSSTSLLMGFR